MLAPMTRVDVDRVASTLHYVEDCVDIGDAGRTALERLQDLMHAADETGRPMPLRTATGLVRDVVTSLGLEIGNGRIAVGDIGGLTGSDVAGLIVYARPFRWSRTEPSLH